jgi:D-beta-D-heptose 7-phosphate kinase/D-beta-D-heptose 1-phosphate adenosyltransferase
VVKQVVVIGDMVLDRDVEGAVERVSPDAPAPVVDVAADRDSPGGAGLAAQLCAAAADVAVTLVAPVADDAPGRRLAELLEPGVRLVRLPHRGATRTKTRVRSSGQSLVRLDTGGPGEPVDPPLDAIAAALGAADVVLVADYGAGTTRHDGIRELLARTAGSTPLVWDPHPRGGAPVPGAALVTPNLSEAGRFAGLDASGEPPERLAALLRECWRARGVCVTAGAAGAWLALPDSEALFVPATAADGDACGAGDRFAAAAALALARGAPVSEAVVAAVATASDWVAAGGIAAHRRAAARAATPAPASGPAAGSAPNPALDAVPGEDLDPGLSVVDVGGGGPVAAAEAVIRRIRDGGGTVVAAGGCFDVLHAGHLAYLEAARRLGDGLVVLLNSDRSVRRRKGPGRPVTPQDDRARVLAGLSCVDAVAVFDEDGPERLLDRLRPDVWTKGGDYAGAELPESAVVRGYGGRVVLLPYLGGRSSSAILRRAQDEPRGASA